MSLEFLSDDWFAKLAELRAAASEVETPPALAGHVVNVTVRGGTEETRLALVGGTLERGHRPEAATTIVLPFDMAKRFLIDGDRLAGIQGFMAGQIHIEGDARMLKPLRDAQPTASQAALQQRIRDMTA
jgi:hypothetical protein